MSISYLVDSVATLSLVPHRSLQALSGLTIVNANGGVIPSWHFVLKDLSFNSQFFQHKLEQIFLQHIQSR
jgi:hypothetical protein